jgi:hypothetical protein
LTLPGRKKLSKLPSINTRTASLSTTGAWIGAALAISTQVKPLAAAAPANAADAFRKSRRLNVSVIGSSRLITAHANQGIHCLRIYCALRSRRRATLMLFSGRG